MTRPIDRVDETSGYVSLSWSTDEEMDQNLKQGAGTAE